MTVESECFGLSALDMYKKLEFVLRAQRSQKCARVHGKRKSFSTAKVSMIRLCSLRSALTISNLQQGIVPNSVHASGYRVLGKALQPFRGDVSRLGDRRAG